MASFRKRGNVWQYTVELGVDPITGRRKQVTKGGFRTKKLAQLAASKIEENIDDGTYVTESDITFSEFVDVWLSYYSKYVKPSTVAVRRTSINRLKKYIKNVKIRDISRSYYIKILQDLQSSGSPVNTIKTIHSTASLVFSYALNEEAVIKVNPTLNVDFRFLKLESNAVDDLNIKDSDRFLEKEDLATFLQVAKSRSAEHPQDYIIFLILAYTGLRRGELAVLKWSDVDLVNHTISVNKAFSYGVSHKITDVVLGPPKTKESKRVVDVDDFVTSQLKTHREWQLSFANKNKAYYNDLDFVFINTHQNLGYPVAPQSIYVHMRSILKVMDHPYLLSPHSMRHTHASLCVEAGIPLRDIAERLGQRDTQMLEKVYAHTTKGQKEKVSRKFNQLMEKVREEMDF